MKVNGKDYRTVWMEGDVIKIINQPVLPHRFEILELKNYNDVAEAIRTMKVRGAPAIGATGAYGLAQAALHAKEKDFKLFLSEMNKIKDVLASTRPTAYDLFYGLDKISDELQNASSVDEARKNSLKASEEYADNSVEDCRKIGEYGEKLIKDNFRILTHCNAGALATVDYGTALAPMRTAHYNKKNIFVFVDETRPRLQGARLTAWELQQEGIPLAVIADNAAGYYMWKKEIDLVIVGSDRIAANGDIANKIGTYEKAVLAKENDIPFYVAAPRTTVDFDCASGDRIPIEERDEKEVLELQGKRLAPQQVLAKNPAFDVTPAEYITGIITEEGIFKPEEIKELDTR